MQTALLCLCLCLLSTALSTPVPPPLPGRAAGNCVGQHRILLKGCNAKHGFYIFEYIYSISTRRNQTQIKKEEADSQSIIPSHRLDEDNTRQGPTENGAAPEQHGNGSADVTKNGIGFKPENYSAPGIGGHAQSPRPGTSTRARGGVGIAGPTLASSEGSGDLDFVAEVDGGVSILPQGERPSETGAGNRSSVRTEGRDDGAPGRLPAEGILTAGRDSTPATGGAGDEGSGETTIPGQGQEGNVQGTGMEGATLASITENMEDVKVDAKGVDEYAYIPDSDSVTITRGKTGNTMRDTSFTQISPDKDDEISIFIGRANIHVREQETTQASATIGSQDDSILTVGTISPMPRLGVTVTHGDDDGDISAHRKPEGPATTTTSSHEESTTSSPRDGDPTGDNEDGATTIDDGEGPATPSPWKVAGGDITVPAEIGIGGNSDGKVRGGEQKFKGRPGHLAVITPRQEGDKKATATVPAKQASILMATTMVTPRVSEGDCTTTMGMASSRKTGESTMAGREGSGEVRPATPQPHREGQPRAEVRARPGGAGLDETPRVDKAPSPRGKASSRASSGAVTKASSHGSDDGARQRATKVGSSSPSQAEQAGGSSMAAVKGQERGQGSETGVVRSRGGRLPGRHGRRLGAGAPGAFAAMGHSRQVDQVKRANEVHVRERSFYTLGGAGAGPHGPYASLGSADSSQSSEAEQGSLSDSRQTGLQPSGWGAPAGHPYGRWSQDAL